MLAENFHGRSLVERFISCEKQTQKLARFSFPRQESYLFLLIKPDSIPDIERKIIFPVLFTYTTGAPKAEK